MEALTQTLYWNRFRFQCMRGWWRWELQQETRFTARFLDLDDIQLQLNSVFTRHIQSMRSSQDSAQSSHHLDLCSPNLGNLYYFPHSSTTIHILNNQTRITWFCPAPKSFNSSILSSLTKWNIHGPNNSGAVSFANFLPQPSKQKTSPSLSLATKACLAPIQ